MRVAMEYSNEDIQTLLDYAKEQKEQAVAAKKNAYGMGMASSFSSLAGSFIDYANLRSDISNLRVQAGQVELQAKQRANQLREQFVQSIGTYMFGAAKRGISVQSASVRGNLQRSSEALGKDVQRMEQNAALQANAYRQQAKIAKKNAQAQLYGSLIQGAADFGLNAYGYANAK